MSRSESRPETDLSYCFYVRLLKGGDLLPGCSVKKQQDALPARREQLAVVADRSTEYSPVVHVPDSAATAGAL